MNEKKVQDLQTRLNDKADQELRNALDQMDLRFFSALYNDSPGGTIKAATSLQVDITKALTRSEEEDEEKITINYDQFVQRFKDVVEEHYKQYYRDVFTKKWMDSIAELKQQVDSIEIDY